jgi:flavin-dependent dehydrogenase
MTFDVVVVGGGPGGAVCAARLAEHGRRVLVLERDRFPRFHLGESLLPQSMPVLDALGLMPEMQARFLDKHGARFHHDESGRSERYSFTTAFDARFTHAFQVPRDEFDDLLLRTAEKKGAEVRHEWTVKRVRFEGDRAVGVEAVDPAGAIHAIDARFVVDASGRDALLAGDRRTKSKIDRLDKSSFYAHYQGVPQKSGVERGDIDVVVFSRGWFWFIPFKDGRTSVGAVVGSAWIKENRDAGDATALLARAVSQSPTAQKLLAGATPLWPARAAADYSYRVGETVGHGWLMVGDAGGFIDPLFSSGAHIAIRTAYSAADRIHDALSAGDVSAARFAEWVAEGELGAATFTDAVHAFYAGGLLRYLFAEKKHTFLRRSVTSLLSGDVYSPDTRWIKDVRVRLAEMASPEWSADPLVAEQSQRQPDREGFERDPSA